jgi:hypothetical protein
MNTRTEKQATAITAIAAAPRIARSTVCRSRVAWTSRGLKGSASEIVGVLRRSRGAPVSTLRRAARQVRSRAEGARALSVRRDLLNQARAMM